MGAVKVRLVDADIISNLLKTLPRSSLNYGITRVNSLRIVTTNHVENEVKILIQKLSNGSSRSISLTQNEIKEVLLLWKEFRAIIDVKYSIVDPSVLKNIGERSLVNMVKKEIPNSKIVSNNRGDVLRYLEDEDLDGNILETPFEFYEEVGRYWFTRRSDTIKFMILSNHDYKVVNKEYCGSILRYVS